MAEEADPDLLRIAELTGTSSSMLEQWSDRITTIHDLPTTSRP